MDGSVGEPPSLQPNDPQPTDLRPSDLRHGTLEATRSTDLELPAAIPDRARLAVLLQAAGLLAHLELHGPRLVCDWSGARVSRRGILRGVALRSADVVRPARELSLDLLARLFGSLEAADTAGTEPEGAAVSRRLLGRGTTRKIVRQLQRDWRSSLVTASARVLIVSLLEQADFLWTDRYAFARCSLAGQRRGSHGSWQDTFVGPEAFRQRLLSRTSGGARTAGLRLGEALASNFARELWVLAEAVVDPIGLAARGRWRPAVEAWGRRPPRDEGERLEYAGCLFATGQFKQALAVARSAVSTEARVVELESLYRLSEFYAAQRLLRRVDWDVLAAADRVRVAEAAVRICSNQGRFADSAEWVDWLGDLPDEPWRSRARLLCATAAWDAGRIDSMASPLEEARALLDVPNQRWRWLQADGLRSMALGDGEAVVRSLRQALGSCLRTLKPFEAAGLWNDLGVGHGLLGDLAGAERAFRHAVRRLERSKTPRRMTLALSNFAEVRVRRGRFDGIDGILTASRRRNRRSKNWHGLVHDLELAARLALGRGALSEALERVDQAGRVASDRKANWRAGELAVLRARALGWSGREGAARAVLEPVALEAICELEPEERPALLQLAGLPQRAFEQVAVSGCSELWSAVLDGGAIPAASWAPIDRLEPYRAARLMMDLELIRPGIVPPARRVEARQVLASCGAPGMAVRLGGSGGALWEAVEERLQGAVDESSVRELFEAAGYPEVRLRWIGSWFDRTWLDGSGGDHELAICRGDGQWVLRSRRTSARLRCLFRLLVDHLPVPVDPQVVCEPAIAELSAHRDPASKAPASPGGDEIVGNSPQLRQALERLDRLAATDVPILIAGETGTGKELFAVRAHRMSPRQAAPIRPLNCAAVSESLLLSDLFGHVRGAFTGADKDRAGVFESARGGTVFLDEIADLPASAQGALLRVLQEGEIRRVGESETRPVDVRVVAASHYDLRQRVAAGTFRKDLLFRLSVGRVSLPPLRDRANDLEMLVQRFLDRLGSPYWLPEPSLDKLRSYAWPGNVRELKNVLEVAAALSPDSRIEPTAIELPVAARSRLSYKEEMFRHRRKIVGEALAQSNGNRAAAARRLDLTRQALSYLVRELDLD